MWWDVFQVYNFETIIRYGIAITVFISSLLAVIYTIWGGVLMVVSWGNEQKVKDAVNHIRYAILGIVILVLVIVIAPHFLNLFGLRTYGDYFSPSSIFATIQEISATILGSRPIDNYSYGDTVVTPADDAFDKL